MSTNVFAVGHGPYALTVSGIRLQIFKELDASNLMRVALVCRAWAGPAIDTRWRNYPIPFSAVLRPLIKVENEKCSSPPVSRPHALEVSDLLNSCMHKLMPNIYDAPELSTEDWALYQLQYAEKATHIILDMEWDEDLQRELKRLMDHHGAPLCPNLRTLEYELDTNDYCEAYDCSPLLRLLVGSNLKNIVLTIRDVPEDVIDDNIWALAHIAPQLHNLVINNYEEYSINYLAFHQLRSLEVSGYFGHADWISLARCPGLERIVLDTDDTYFGFESQTYSVTFPRLRALYFIDRYWSRAVDYGFIVDLIRNSTMPVLRTLGVRVEASDKLREGAKNVIVRHVRGRSPMLKRVVIKK